jgi:acyl-coenzyme A thioesterase PaaI-like protein
VDLRVSYLNPAVGDTLFAKGWVIKAGQKLYFCEAELWTVTHGEKLVTVKASATMAAI